MQSEMTDSNIELWCGEKKSKTDLGEFVAFSVFLIFLSFQWWRKGSGVKWLDFGVKEMHCGLCNQPFSSSFRFQKL